MKKINSKKIVVIIQARTTSTRLPNKVLMKIKGKQMLWHVINRLKFSKKINEIILAIPNRKDDDILEKFAKNNNIKYFRGSRDNVLSRYYGAAKKFQSDIIVRITSDCPLIDPRVVDSVVMKHLKTRADYTSNVLKRTFPRGLDVEVFNFNILKQAYKNAKKRYEKEHVTPYMREHSKVFKLQNLETKNILRRPDLRLTVDTKEDMKLIKKIYNYLYKDYKQIFYTDEVVELFNREPELAKINFNIEQKKLK